MPTPPIESPEWPHWPVPLTPNWLNSSPHSMIPTPPSAIGPRPALGNLAPASKTAATSVCTLLQDKSAVVRIAAARALCRMGQPDEALPILTAELETGAQWERLHAAIVLDEIDEQAKPVIESMQAALKPRKDLYANGKYTIRVLNRALNQLQGTENIVE